MHIKKNRILYLGHDPSRYEAGGELHHFPIIKTKPYLKSREIRSAFSRFSQFTHILCTSRQAVFCMLKMMYIYRIDEKELSKKQIMSIGAGTRDAFKGKAGPILMPKSFTSEALIDFLDQEDIKKNAFLFYPHSKLARSLIEDYLKKKKFNFISLILYTTVPNMEGDPPRIDLFDEIVFTSPSTIDAFLTIYGKFPEDKKFTFIGPITASYFEKVLTKPG
jgi:uroporphyrinogen-III synthase